MFHEYDYEDVVDDEDLKQEEPEPIHLPKR